MRNYAERFQCYSTYNIVYKVFTSMLKCGKHVFAVTYLNGNSMKTRQPWCHAPWWKLIHALWPLMWHKWNILFFASFNLTFRCCACASQSSAIVGYFRRYVSSQPRGFLLDSFQMKMKRKKKKTKTIRKTK